MSEESVKELVKSKVIDLKKCGHIDDQWLGWIVSDWLTFYQAAVSENPPGVASFLVGCMQGIYLKDRSIVDRAIELTKENVEEEDFLLLVGRALCCLGERDDGLKYMRMHKDKYPSEEATIGFMVALDAQSEKAEEIEHLCKEVLENNPNNLDALWMMASVWLYRDCPEEAFPYIERARAINPKEDFVRFYYAQYLYQKGKYKEALRYFKKCPKKAPPKPHFEYPHYWEHLFLCYYELGRLRKAEKALRRMEKCLKKRGIFDEEKKKFIRGYYDDLEKASGPEQGIRVGDSGLGFKY